MTKLPHSESVELSAWKDILMNCLGSQCPICNPFAIFQAVESLYSRPSKKEGAGKPKLAKKNVELFFVVLVIMSSFRQRPKVRFPPWEWAFADHARSPFDERILPAFTPEAITTKTIIFCERVFEALNLCCGPKTLINIQQVIVERRFVNKEQCALVFDAFFVIYVLISLKSQYQIQLICDLNPLAFL